MNAYRSFLFRLAGMILIPSQENMSLVAESAKAVRAAPLTNVGQFNSLDIACYLDAVQWALNQTDTPSKNRPNEWYSLAALRDRLREDRPI